MRQFQLARFIMECTLPNKIKKGKLVKSFLKKHKGTGNNWFNLEMSEEYSYQEIKRHVLPGEESNNGIKEIAEFYRKFKGMYPKHISKLPESEMYLKLNTT